MPFVFDDEEEEEEVIGAPPALPQLPWRETAERDDCAVLLFSLRMRFPDSPSAIDGSAAAAVLVLPPGREG